MEYLFFFFNNWLIMVIYVIGYFFYDKRVWLEVLVGNFFVFFYLKFGLSMYS